MASTLVKLHKMESFESRKSYSRWDTHINPKTSKWLEYNREEMEQNVKRMLKLIKDDGDSFAKRAEMYYQKRPELINLVEDFLRMYRSLADRYSNVIGELRKHVASDLQSQGSGISEITSEPTSICPSPDHQPSRRRSGPRAAGFDIFLGTSRGSSESGYREGDESSTLDSESESHSDDSVVSYYSGAQGNEDDSGLQRKITELELELRDMKEKQKNENVSESGTVDILLSRIEEYEEELRNAKENLRVSEEETNRLRKELQRYESLNSGGELDSLKKDAKSIESCLEVARNQVTELQESIDRKAGRRVLALEEELRNTKEKLHGSEKEVAALRVELENSQTCNKCLQEQLGSMKKDLSVWKGNLRKEEREVLKLQDRINRYRSSLSDRDQDIRQLKESISNANSSLSEENMHLQAEVSRLKKEISYMENNLKEMDLKCQSLEEVVRRVKSAKSDMEASLGAEIEQLKMTISERNDQIAEMMAKEKELNIKVAELIADTGCKDDRIDELNKYLHQLHTEHVMLISELNGARKLEAELRSRVRELEEKVEQQEEVIQEGAEEKREAIRQLCFSLEHYRNGYHRLREAVIGQKMNPVMAS